MDELSFRLDRHIERVTEEVVRDAAVYFLSEHVDILDIDPVEFGEIRITNTDGDYL